MGIGILDLLSSVWFGQPCRCVSLDEFRDLGVPLIRQFSLALETEAVPLLVLLLGSGDCHWRLLDASGITMAGPQLMCLSDLALGLEI